MVPEMDKFWALSPETSGVQISEIEKGSRRKSSRVCWLAAKEQMIYHIRVVMETVEFEEWK